MTPSTLTYGAAFATGLLGAGHCLGMCGGLVCAYFLRPEAVTPVQVAAYHGGRLAVYATLGLLAAALGTIIASTGRFGLAQGVLQILAGLAVIAFGLEMLGRLRLTALAALSPMRWLGRPLGAARRRGPLVGALAGGIANGLMPCSMTMAMAAQASTAPGAGDGALLMLSFGVGTLPAMLSATWLFGRVGLNTRRWFVRAAGVMLLLLGASTLWQGLRYTSTMARLLP